MTTSQPCSRCGQTHTGCTGHKRGTGQPCRKPCRPGEVCTHHGGRAPQVHAAQERRRAEQKAAAMVATLGLPVDTTPTEALLEEVRWTAGHVQWLRQRVQGLDEVSMTRPNDGEQEHGTGGPQGAHALVWGQTEYRSATGGENAGRTTVEKAAPSIWYELYAKERQHLVTVCAAAIKAGVEERRVRLAEQQGDLVAEVIRRILADLNLTDEQQRRVPEVVPRQLRLIAGGAA